MMKFKKLVALTCAATMLLPSSAVFAADGTLGGDSAVENNNAVVPAYNAIVLPTASTDIYDFTIDREGLLANHDKVNTYEGTAGVYFETQKAAAKIELTTAATDANKTNFFVKVKNEDTSLTKLLAAITGKTVTAAFPDSTSDSDPAANFYVWIPKSGSEAQGLGEYKRITKDYLDFTLDGSSQITAVTLKAPSAALPHDNKVYVEEFGTTFTDGEKAVEYLDFTSDSPSASQTRLYIGSADGSTVAPVLITSSDYTYTAATSKYADSSYEVKITNKSLNPIAISAKATMKVAEGKTDGLTYVSTSTVADTANASIYLAITNGSNAQAFATANGATTANAYYVLPAATFANSLVTYQGATTEAGTGSHQYYQYLPTAYLDDDSYSSATFTLKAAVNKASDANTAWDTYIAALTADDATVVKPTIEVVYSWETVTAETVESATVYKNAAGTSTYTPASGTSGWATVEEVSADPIDPIDPIAAANAWSDDLNTFYVALSDEGGITDAEKIGDVKFELNDELVAVTASHDETLGGWIEIAYSDLTTAGYVDNGTLTVQFTYDGVLYTTTSTW